MKIIKDIEIKEKKVYFTTSVAIVLFIIIAGCVSTQPHTTPVQTASQTTPTPTPATSSPPQQEKLPNKTLRPISAVTSVQESSPCSGNEVCNPAGPSSRITVNATSSTDVPVTQLSATVFFVSSYAPTSPGASISFSFHVSDGNPLMPDQTASETSYAVIGPVQLLNANGTTAVFIEGTLQNGQSFSYWTNDTTS